MSAALAIDDSVGISHHLAGGVYAKETRIPAGHVLVQHKHSYDHLSVLASGTVEVEVEGVRTRYTGPACLTIKAEAHHGVRSVTDAVWFCIHASNVADDDALISVETSVTEMEAIAAGLAR